jgi:hypothetical protein
MADVKAAAAGNILLGAPGRSAHHICETLAHHRFKVARAVVAARRDIMNDVEQQCAGSAEPLGEAAQLPEGFVAVLQLCRGIEHANAARQQIQRRGKALAGVLV